VRRQSAIVGRAFPPDVQFPREREFAPGEHPAVRSPVTENTHDLSSARELSSRTQLRSKGSNPRTAEISTCRSAGSILWSRSGEADLERPLPLSGRGLISLTAFWMIARRAQERAHSLKTGLPTDRVLPQTGDEALLSPPMIGPVSRKRKQVEAVYVFAKDPAEIIGGCVLPRLW